MNEEKKKRENCGKVLTRIQRNNKARSLASKIWKLSIVIFLLCVGYIFCQEETWRTCQPRSGSFIETLIRVFGLISGILIVVLFPLRIGAGRHIKKRYAQSDNGSDKSNDEITNK